MMSKGGMGGNCCGWMAAVSVCVWWGGATRGPSKQAKKKRALAFRSERVWPIFRDRFVPHIRPKGRDPDEAGVPFATLESTESRDNRTFQKRRTLLWNIG